MPSSAYLDPKIKALPALVRFKLGPNEAIGRGQRLVTPSQKGGYLALQTDGNLVLYDAQNRAIWSPNLAGRGSQRFVMQPDGNAVVYDTANRAIWATGTQGHPGAFIQLQDDGNLVVYAGKVAIWSSYTPGWQYHPPSKNALVQVASFVGSGVGTAAHVITKVPILGVAAKATYNFSPLSLGVKILSGERVDRAVIDNFRDQAESAKEVAPYAALVVSFVPGIGAGAAAAISAGVALAEGKSITAAVVAGIRGAVPGGAVGQVAFDVGTKLVAGASVTESILTAARNQVPAGPARVAFDVGVAVATGKKLQDAILVSLANIGATDLANIITLGAAIAGKDAIIKAAKDMLPDPGKLGFDAAIGLTSQPSIKEAALNIARGKIPAEAKKGFDTAIALGIGRKEADSLPTTEKMRIQSMAIPARASYYVTLGLAHGKAPAATRKAVVKPMVLTAHGQAGVRAALTGPVTAHGSPLSWWQRFLQDILEIPRRLTRYWGTGAGAGKQVITVRNNP